MLLLQPTVTLKNNSMIFITLSFEKTFLKKVDKYLSLWYNKLINTTLIGLKQKTKLGGVPICQSKTFQT